MMELILSILIGVALGYLWILVRPFGIVPRYHEFGFPDEVLNFPEAFAAARARGVSEFTWRGNRYHTRTAEEERATNEKPAISE